MNAKSNRVIKPFARIISRRAHEIVKAALDRQAAVALLGPRQVGKTTLARS